MTSVCDTCKRDKCRVRMDGLRTCDMRVTESNWERLFGTPERAARTLERKFASCNGNVCIAPNVDYDALLEWLGGDA